MIRKIKRTKEYELTLVINDDSFISPPREFQRNAILNRVMFEYANDLQALHQSAEHYVPGAIDAGLKMDRTQAALSDQQIMEDWQLPVMKAMAEAVCESQGDILEIGFGRGISSTMIQGHQVKSHTIIECNQSIIDKFHDWRSEHSGAEIKLVKGLWQDTIEDLPQYDGIFFHTYPLNDEEYMQYVHGRVTFAEHFFSTAAQHLKPAGIFTYFSNESDSLSRAHQRALFQHFSEISIKQIELQLPPDVKDTWWADSMIIVKAIK